MVCYKDRYYASADNWDRDSNTVYIYKYNKSWLFKKWKKVYSFGVCEDKVIHSICDDLIACSGGRKILNFYSLHGKLQEVSDILYCGYSLHEFYGDDVGIFLVCDASNNIVRVMSERACQNALELEPAVERPRSVALYKKHLFISCDKGNSVYKYFWHNQDMFEGATGSSVLKASLYARDVGASELGTFRGESGFYHPQDNFMSSAKQKVAFF